MKRKAQVINIDYSIGLGLLILTLSTAILIMADYQPFNPEDSLKNKASEIQSDLREESSIDGFKNQIIVKSPYNLSNIPIDRNYSFPENAYPGSGFIESGGIVQTSKDKIYATVDYENGTNRMVYFTENVSSISHEYDISSGEWLNNSNISLKPGNPGIQSLQINGKEVLNSTAEIGGSETTESRDFYGTTLSGDLKMYNSSRELILENPQDPILYLKNFTTLYWGEDNSTTDLIGEKDSFKSGKTSGFTVGSDYGVTFVGNMTANVSKPENDTVKAEISAERLRIRLHDTDYTQGWKRIKAFEKGYFIISGREKISGPNIEKLEKLEKSPEPEFEQNLSLEDWGYNISVRKQSKEDNILKRGRKIPLRDAATLKLGIGSLNRKGDSESLISRVVVWR